MENITYFIIIIMKKQIVQFSMKRRYKSLSTISSNQVFNLDNTHHAFMLRIHDLIIIIRAP